MNNLLTLRSLFQLSREAVAEQTKIAADTLNDFEQGTQEPTFAQWQTLAEFYSDQYHVAKTQPAMVEPIHFRLSVDYLMNIGMTMTDLIAIKWYFANLRPELGTLGVALFNPNDSHDMERLTTSMPDVLEDFAGYLLLNHDGTLNQFIDERNEDHVSDWRLLLYKDENNYVDITDIVSYFVDLPDFTKF
ncbi:XRE family transcriptional regulator [Weissella viridescens]|uniref:XRE family transcriptional regulator n=1 Tax=Weissella viridescens TaxID=1629 RepID=A0A3P2REC5_WEIVI|nr:helix-turn-helix transcriptional regulator [Weissella viridescens]RRG17765.1 XRE family transcriptional regulator [Weissella viridescens]